MIGASGVHPARLTNLPTPSFIEGKEPDLGFTFAVGARELKSTPLTTKEETTRVWEMIQTERRKRKSTAVEKQRTFAVPDDTPLIHQTLQAVGGQWEPGLILHACPMTEERQRFLGLRENHMVAVINPLEGSGTGVASSQNQVTANEELPEEELDSIEAR